jgi:hypothetical protein
MSLRSAHSHPDCPGVHPPAQASTSAAYGNGDEGDKEFTTSSADIGDDEDMPLR